MHRRIVRTAALAAALMVGLAAVAPNHAGATTFLPLTLENMADVSTAIVEGEVVDTWTELDEHGSVWTRVKVSVSDVWKGHRVARELIVSEHGGSVGHYRTEVPGRAVFSKGEELLLFLHLDSQQRWVPVGKYLGKMTIRRAQGESRHHLMRWHPRAEWTFDHRFLPHPPVDERLYLDDLEARIRAQMAAPWDGHEIPGVDASFLSRVNTHEIRSAQ